MTDASKRSGFPIGILGDDLQAELQGVCFVWNGVDFMADRPTKMLDPIEETPLPVAACV